MYKGLHWKGKPLCFTRHALEELDDSGKCSDAVVEMIDFGEHKKESRDKWIAKKRKKTGWQEAVYREYDNRVLVIHLRL
ncbi:MAG: hypothetical protein V1911_01550 [Candidatus Micrarchaeota archaeon]